MKDQIRHQDESLEEVIINQYRHDQIFKIYDAFFSTFLNKAPEIFTEWHLNREEFEGLTIRKREISRLIAIVFSDKDLFQKWFQNLPYLTTRVLESVLWEGKQSIISLNQRTKGKIFNGNPNHEPDHSQIADDFCLFQITQLNTEPESSKATYFFELPLKIRQKLKSYLPKPKGYELKPLRLPLLSDFEFCDDGKILDYLPVILDFVKRGNLDLTKTDKPKKSSLNRLIKLCESHEFYGESSESDLKYIRMELLVSLCLMIKSPTRQNHSLEVLKDLYAQLHQLNENVLLSFLSNIKGWYQNGGLINPGIIKTIVELLQFLPLEKYISVKQLLRFALVRDMDICPVNESKAIGLLYLPNEWSGWGSKKTYLNMDMLEAYITIPMLKLVFFCLAAIGMVDIKYDKLSVENNDGIDENSDINSVYDGLNYIRLNTLGAFICGRLSDYEITEQSEATHIYFDDDRLLMSLSRPDRPLEIKLEAISKRVGRLRFKVTTESIVSNCETMEDFKKQIEVLHELSQGDLPKNWVFFLENLRSKNPSLVINEQYVIYQIDQSNAELVDIIANDPDIRRLILMVEDYKIAVKTNNISDLKSRMKILGYLF